MIFIGNYYGRVQRSTMGADEPNGDLSESESNSLFSLDLDWFSWRHAASKADRKPTLV